MSGLSSDDMESIAAWEPHADWCDYEDKSPEGCTPEFGCNVWRRRELLAGMVEAIVARHVTAALTEAARAIEQTRKRIAYVDTRLAVDLATTHNIAVGHAANIVRDRIP